MNMLGMMVPIALLLGLGFLGAFIWAAKSGQYDDLDTPAIKILDEDKDLKTLLTINKQKGQLSDNKG